MTIVMGVDPGPLESAYVLWDGEHIVEQADAKNEDILEALRDPGRSFNIVPPNVVAIEQIRGFGVMASDALFDTCWYSGRFYEAFGAHRTFMVPRKEAAAHVCGVGGISKDQFVREAIISRFGGKERAVGTKKDPGPLHGVSGHRWAALAICLTWWDKHAAVVGELA